MANTTVGGIVIHDGNNAVIQDNTVTKDSNIVVMPLYLSDSDGTDAFDFGGVTKSINLSGSYQDSSVANIKTWLESVEALAQGHQDIAAGYPLTFVDDLRGTIKVKVLSFSTTWLEGDPLRITWSLKLVQSSENA